MENQASSVLRGWRAREYGRARDGLPQLCLRHLPGLEALLRG